MMGRTTPSPTTGQAVVSPGPRRMLPMVTLWRSITSAPSTVPVLTTSPWPCRTRSPGPAWTWGGSSTPRNHSTTKR